MTDNWGAEVILHCWRKIERHGRVLIDCSISSVSVRITERLQELIVFTKHNTCSGKKKKNVLKPMTPTVTDNVNTSFQGGFRNF